MTYQFEAHRDKPVRMTPEEEKIEWYKKAIFMERDKVAKLRKKVSEVEKVLNVMTEITNSLLSDRLEDQALLQQTLLSDRLEDQALLQQTLQEIRSQL